MIHNAGWVSYQTIEEQDNDFLARSLQINVWVTGWLNKYAWPHLKRSSAARVIFTTSDRAMYQRYAQPGLNAYAVGKMAQLGMMNALSKEGEHDGILVNAVSPVARTRMWGTAEQGDDLKPEHIFTGVLYLVSPHYQKNGNILRASNGQFTTTRFCENPGVTYPVDLTRVPCASLQAVVENWPRIMEFSHA